MILSVEFYDNVDWLLWSCPLSNSAIAKRSAKVSPDIIVKKWMSRVIVCVARIGKFHCWGPWARSIGLNLAVPPLHRQWWCLHVGITWSRGTKNNKQLQTNKINFRYMFCVYVFPWFSLSQLSNFVHLSVCPSHTVVYLSESASWSIGYRMPADVQNWVYALRSTCTKIISCVYTLINKRFN